jgi:hypothetical protein
MKTKIPFIFILILFFYSKNYAQVNTERFRIATDSLGFSVRSDLDFTLMVGNTDFQYMGTNTRFNYNWGRHYTFLVINGGFGKNNGKSFLSQALTHFRNVNSLSHFVQLEEFLQYDNNKKHLLIHRFLIGGGFRFKIVKTEIFVSRIGTSIFYEHEEYDLPSGANHKLKTKTVRFSSYLTFLLKLKKDIVLLSTTYFQPAMNNIDDIRVLSDNAININLGKNIDLTMKINIQYDSHPADAVKRFDMITKLGVALNFE